MPPLARELARAVLDVLGPQPGQSCSSLKPYVFVGHAFGAVIAHETARVLCEKETFSCIATYECAMPLPHRTASSMVHVT